jgi:hypothetical protein
MHQDTKFWVKCGENQILLCTTNKWFRQYCGLSLYLFSVLINDIIGCIDMDGTHSPVVYRLNTPGILLAYELAVARATGRSLEQGSPIACKRVCVCVCMCP